MPFMLSASLFHAFLRNDVKLSLKVTVSSFDRVFILSHVFFTLLILLLAASLKDAANFFVPAFKADHSDFKAFKESFPFASAFATRFLVAVPRSEKKDLTFSNPSLIEALAFAIKSFVCTALSENHSFIFCAFSSNVPFTFTAKSNAIAVALPATSAILLGTLFVKKSRIFSTIESI